MENLHLKNLKNIPNISEFYLKQVEKILDTKTNIIDYALKTTIRNPELEKFKVNFLKYYTDDNYLPYKDLLAFWRFTQIVTELNNAILVLIYQKQLFFKIIILYIKVTKLTKYSLHFHLHQQNSHHLQVLISVFMLF